MSVLVFDGETLAADTHANDGHTSFPLVKLWKHEGNQEIIGTAGLVADMNNLIAWYKAGKLVPDFPKNISDQAVMVVVSKRTGLIRYNRSPLGTLHGRNKVAFGSGKDFAYGALYMGATAVQAVHAAIKYCASCGGDASFISLSEFPDA